MKIGLVIGGLLLAVLAGLWLFTPSNGEDVNSNESTNEISSIAQTAQLASSKAGAGEAYLYDVRSPEEFAAGNAQNSQNHDVELLKVGTMPDAPKDAELYLYCRSGNRSNQAAQILEQNGFTNVTDLGGLPTMQEAGVL